MSDNELREKLEEQFSGIIGDEKCIQECISICRNYALPVEELYYRWEAMNYRPHRDATASISIFSYNDAIVLKESIQQEQIKKVKKAKDQKHRASLNTLFSRPKSTASTSQPVKVNSKVLFKGPSGEPTAKESRHYRYMFEKIIERSEVLDRRIDELTEVIRDHYGIEEFGDPSSITEEDIIVMGRICGDADSSSVPTSKLTEGSIYLESTRATGYGGRILLKFDSQLKFRGIPEGVTSLGIFPGVIVALKGRNGGGGCFVVKEVYSFPSMPARPQSDRVSRPGFTMCAMCGPYTTDGDLQYKQFSSALEKVKLERPEVLLLLGPFVDTFHPKIKIGDTDHTPKELFEQHFVENIQSLLSGHPDMLVLLVPSVKDILSDHAVFPQCEFDKDVFQDPRVKMLPNPCRFTLNDRTFAVTSVDILFHLRNQEYTLRGEGIDPRPLVGANDPLANSCRQILQQRSFYPLFPAPQDMAHEVNLDISHSSGLSLDSEDRYAPEVLIAPSRLKQFTKMVETTLTVNPSFATKGTCARFKVAATTTDSKGQISCEIL